MLYKLRKENKLAVEFKDEFWETTWAYKKGLKNQLKATILAAGLGKRMDPLTVNHLPKPLFPLGGKVPMAELWVRRFVDSGIADVSMNLCVLSDTIKRHFKDGSKFVANITFVDENEPTGTLGGICKQALGRNSKIVLVEEKIPDIEEFEGSTIIAPSGDVVTNFGSELLEEMYGIHKKVGSAFTMVLVPVPRARRKDFGTVILDNPKDHKGLICQSGKITEFREKDPDSPSNLNNASIYMIEMDLIKELDKYRTPAKASDIKNPFYDFGKHVFPAMLGQLDYISLSKDFLLWGIKYSGEWFDVGQKRDYLNVNEALLNEELDVTLPYEKLPWGYLGSNTIIDFSEVTIIPPVIVGNNCIIEKGATIGPYAVIGDDWRIQRDASVRHSVLWERYSFFTKKGKEISANDRMLQDRHVIREGITVEECIVVGGSIEEDIRKKTVDVDENGDLSMLPIDWVPEGPRA
ncbi:MAG: sugar phosphate nucleotidyltransferase [Candidatus Hodarchaeales archaeon]